MRLDDDALVRAAFTVGWRMGLCVGIALGLAAGWIVAAVA